jgi:glycopeptide antibiotics resistance protein
MATPPVMLAVGQFLVLKKIYNVAQQYCFQEIYHVPHKNGRRPCRQSKPLFGVHVMYFDLLTVLLFGLIWIGIVRFLRLKKRKSLAYLVFFTIFYIYIVKVLDYTLFQFQSLILLKYFMPNLMLNGQTVGKSINLIPLITLTLQDLQTSLLNILLLIPFGFGLPFITNFRMKKIVVIGAFFSIVIEFLQLITGHVAKITFRVADINDVIFNTVGAAIGYMLFIGFVHIYRHLSHHWEIAAHPILRYIAERPQIDK